MISGLTFVYLSACDWNAPWHGPQEIALRLGRAGNRVLYVETLGRRRPRLFDAPRIAGRLARAAPGLGRRREREVAPGVELISPLLVPGARSSAVQALNLRLLARALRRRLPAGAPLVLWIYTPTRLALELVGTFGESLAVYHCTQSHADRPHAPPDTAEVEQRLLGRVGAVVTDGILLHRERAACHPYVYRVASGVNVEEHVGAAPAAWAAELARPVVGYLGSVDHRIDPSLLAGIARARPEWTVAVVGPVTDADVSELTSLPNVVLKGQVARRDVPGVLTAFDVGVMPYAEGPLARYTYPAKLHQYLAAGLPIASTPLPDLLEFADLVETGTGADGLLVAVERALAGPPREEERRAVAARNTWEGRLEALSAIVAGHLRGDPPPSSPGL